MLPSMKAERRGFMKKMIGIVSLCVFGFAAMAGAQVVVAPAADAAVAAPVAAVEAPAAAAVEAAVAEAAVELTIQGEVSVVNGPDGALQMIFINPAEGHGYKVDLVNGEGKTLADKDGKVVSATGVDANRLFTISAITVVE